MSGNTLYGTTSEQGSGGGNGTVFKLNSDGTGFATLYGFTVTSNSVGISRYTNSDGELPNGGLVLSGNSFYGTAYFGGSAGSGTVFNVNTNGTGFATLYNFTRLSVTPGNPGGTNTDGGYPNAGLLLSAGCLYGTARNGGSGASGTVFKVNTNGTGFAVLHTFTNGSDGGGPAGPLVLSGDTLYGAANEGGSAGNGTVFKVKTNGTGFATIHNFTALNAPVDQGGTNSDGAYPSSGLVLAGNTLYGTAQVGGDTGNGTVFKVNTLGTDFATLYSFSATSGSNPHTNTDGAKPYGPLVLAGNTLYGTAYVGGSTGNGTVFKVETNGTGFAMLYSFANGSDGRQPDGGLVFSGDKLYGTAQGGGKGTVFSLQLPFAPVILTQPKSLTVTNGHPASFTVTASGWPSDYQWAVNTTNIAGATNATLVLSNAFPVNSGNYTVTLTNPYGIATSSNATLTVVALAISAPKLLVGGEFQCSFNTVIGVNYAVHYSTTLTNWFPLVTFEGNGGPMTMIDPNAAGSGHRFYRVVLTPN